ncbi:hypothetical protein Tco_1390172, partial [Tanacetum coccineum]
MYFRRTYNRNLSQALNFIASGFQYDYIFDWTILKNQQSQLANPPSHGLGAGAGTSSGVPPVAANLN